MRGAILGILALSAALLVGCSAPMKTKASTKTATTAARSSVAWRPWGDEAFAEARRTDKIVLVDVGIEGCTACRWMYEDTYRDEAVVQLLAESFVTIAVDADVQPDLGSRFEAWGWPATIIMTPEREQVLALRGSRSPEVFAKFLADVVAKKKEGALRTAAETAPAAATRAGTKPLREACEHVTRVLDDDRNTKHGGWTQDGPQYIQGPAIEEAFLRASALGREDVRAHALLTVSGYAKMIDPEWGGVFVAAHEVDFSGVIVEKRLVQEAEAMRSFALAYSATRDEKWKKAIADVDRYIEGFLLDPDGSFYSTQQDEAPGLPSTMTSGDYFRLPDKERRKYGVPPIDHAVYSDQNAQAIEAYVMAYEATGEERHLARAVRAAEVIAKRVSGGLVQQVATTAALKTDNRKRMLAPHSTPYLGTQAQTALAFVALHRATGDARWLDAARSIMDLARRALEDSERGGLWSSTAKLEKPTYENAAAARALHALAAYTHDESFDRAAERTLAGAGATRGAFVALAIEEMALGAIEISITGSADDARGRALYRAALAAHEPRKVVHWDTARKYPARGEPAIYVCTRTSCSSPIRAPERVAAAIAAASDKRSTTCE
jgi:uncharacterized protein